MSEITNAEAVTLAVAICKHEVEILVGQTLSLVDSQGSVWGRSVFRALAELKKRDDQ